MPPPKEDQLLKRITGLNAINAALQTENETVRARQRPAFLSVSSC